MTRALIDETPSGPANPGYAGTTGPDGADMLRNTETTRLADTKMTTPWAIESLTPRVGATTAATTARARIRGWRAVATRLSA